jgi:hypothetical protein
VEPFDTFRAKLPGWTLALTTLDGVMGYTDLDRQTIWVDVNLTDRERRSTIMHEVVHAIHRDSTDDPACERRTQIEAARRLIPPPALRGAFCSTTHPEDVADILDVDLDVLRTRLRNLDPDEKSLLRRNLARTLPPDPTNAHCALGRWWQHYQQPGPLPCHGACAAVTATPAARPAATITVTATPASPVLEAVESIPA